MDSHVVQKNNVSYFEAGFKAGMIIAGIPKEEVNRRFYSTVIWPNLMKNCLEKYDFEEDDTNGDAYLMANL